MHRRIRVAVVALALTLASCAMPPQPQPDLLAPTEEQLKLRSYQSRSFEIADRKRAIRGVMATLQDLGFIIERANAELGLVTAARFAEPNYYDVIAVTVTVRPQAGGKMLIRVNAIYNNAPLEDPKAYQNFFASLQRALFIEQP